MVDVVGSLLSAVDLVFHWIEDNKEAKHKLNGVRLYLMQIKEALEPLQKCDKTKLPESVKGTLKATERCISDLKKETDHYEANHKQFFWRPETFFKKLEDFDVDLSRCVTSLMTAMLADTYVATLTKSNTEPKPNNVTDEANKTNPISKAIDDLLLSKDAKDFWTNAFPSKLDVNVKELVEALSKTSFGPLDDSQQKLVTLRVDPNHDRLITLYEFNKFSTPSMAAAIIKCKPAPADAKAQADIDFDVFWVDANCQKNNKKLLDEAHKKNIKIKHFAAADDFVEFVLKYRDAFEIKFPQNSTAGDNVAKLPRIVSANEPLGLPEGAKLAKEDVATYPRSTSSAICEALKTERWGVWNWPFLIYCGFMKAQADTTVSIYDRMRMKATTSSNICRAFILKAPIPEMAWTTADQE